ncbi:MAG: LacI family DNA-binding transcriptional regulator [Cytophagales bacterium]|nr:LacI family DNA-binding transcriptional regulator [Armatimonadota bacterium]
MSTHTDPQNPLPSAKPTILELAARLSLSKGAVSRILNDKGEGFSEETRRRVFSVAQEIGYVPNPLARALATGRSGFIALWVQTLVTSYHAQVAHAMEEALETHGYQIAVTPFGRFETRREKYAGTPAGVDGMIAHEIYGDILPLLFRGVNRKVPVVTTGIFAPMNGYDHVYVDLSGAAEDAVRHLVRSGRRRIAYASDDIHSRSQDTRFLAYHAVMAESGLEPELIGLPGSDRASIRSALRDTIGEQGCPEALFCHNDDAAIAAYRALCDLKLRVPDDCALVGCDGIPDTEYLPVPITTIVQPYAEMCETACRLLERRLADPDADLQQVTLPALLEIRESSLASPQQNRHLP